MNLVACPFCATHAIVERFDYPRRHTEFFARCRNPECCARGPIRATADAAANAWNAAGIQSMKEAECSA